MNTFLLVFFAAGLVATVWGLQERAGRSRAARAWMQVRRERVWRTALFVRPGLGLGAAIVGSFPLTQDVPVVGVALALLCPVAVLVAFWCGILALPCPEWMIPAYAREQWRERRAWTWP